MRKHLRGTNAIDRTARCRGHHQPHQYGRLALSRQAGFTQRASPEPSRPATLSLAATGVFEHKSMTSPLSATQKKRCSYVFPVWQKFRFVTVEHVQHSWCCITARCLRSDLPAGQLAIETNNLSFTVWVASHRNQYYLLIQFIVHSLGSQP